MAKFYFLGERNGQSNDGLYRANAVENGGDRRRRAGRHGTDCGVFMKKRGQRSRRVVFTHARMDRRTWRKRAYRKQGRDERI